MIGGAIMKKKWIVLLAIILTLTLLDVTALTEFNDTHSLVDKDFRRSKVDILLKWADYRPKFEGDPYLEEANASYPYNLGKLKDEFIQDGLNMANFVRYLAGLPDDLELDDELNNHAQHGAVLLAASQSLTHEPLKPDDMDEIFYEVGENATNRSNIASGISSLSDSVIAYMMDFGDSNLDNVGHRRWILNPQMKKIGFGYCEGYSAMKVLNEDRVEEFEYDYITYPTEGYFPSDIFYASCCPYGSNPWSIILNPQIYDNENTTSIRVELRDLNDESLVWNFCPEYENSPCERYFKVDTSNCGVPFCIIFVPDNIDDYEGGCSYKVKVTGLYTTEGDETEIEYLVNFIDLQ